MRIPDNIRKRLLQLKDASGDSFDKISQSIDIDRSNLHHYLKGEKTLTIEVAQKIADYFGYEIEVSVQMRKKDLDK